MKSQDPRDRFVPWILLGAVALLILFVLASVR